MRWPQHPVERVRPSRFIPPFCPWPECPAHRGRGRGFHRHGAYRTARDPTPTPRYRCLDCGRTCSRSTFSTTYYLKRPDLLVPVAAGLVACGAHRQIARSAGCAKTSVTRLAERLGRHAILLLARLRRHLGAVDEAIVHDHLEAFVGCKARGLGIGTAVGARTWFVYDVDPAPHRRRGRLPDRTPGGRTATVRILRAYIRSIRRTLRVLLAVAPAPGQPRVVLRADGRTDYRAALCDPGLASRFELQTFPNPERGPKGTPRSPEARARDWAMYPVDRLHGLLRHSSAEFKRQTIAFGRRTESVMGRTHVLAVWRNLIKGRSERRPDRTTPAMRVGLTDRPWDWRRVLSRRLFPHREQPSAGSRCGYEGLWSPGMPRFERAHAF